MIHYRTIVVLTVLLFPHVFTKQKPYTSKQKNKLARQPYHGQLLQDKYVHEKFFKNYRNGVFVDIGAHDGITISNSYFFEKNLGWTGICIEPLPHQFCKLQENRQCACIQGCISDINSIDQLLMVSSPKVCTEMLSGLMRKYHPRHLERVKKEIKQFGGSYKLIDVQCYVLNDLLEKHGIHHINFLTIDTEGGELDILKSIDFSRFTIDVIVVEDNYSDAQFIPFLAEKGFTFFERLRWDMVFVRKDFEPICGKNPHEEPPNSH